MVHNVIIAMKGRVQGSRNTHMGSELTDGECR